ncbi:hypothetical protein F5Y08DRAFT_341701 [Xylaria arbuscula]|uniref:Amidohydrolase-related domain-containing protein n=1 Tax=Xylaria arbuscula TaxID=114810 RepID=A0A9W8TIQ0_9PEZI|nr:hypothetical protein F5Y08DRAFT_341701 [Xylaria arbuscula]KAJ3558129.1 hypothetical protein NPX13_g9782 [Xylaria arbuscula]
MILENVVSDVRDSTAARCDIELKDGHVQSITCPSKSSPNTPTQLLLPPLCHPHIHLDKAYILTCNNGTSSYYPDYADLCPRSGSFTEALTNTSQAKERYTHDDLYLRGSQLIATSYTQGVTSMRAFVEIDHVTGLLPLRTAIQLKKDFAHLFEVQICAFAQDPIFSTANGEANRAFMEKAFNKFSSFIGALGTTPYVETSREASLANIEWAITTSLMYNLHLDFHLDYTLESPSPSSQKPFTYSVVEMLLGRNWTQVADSSKTIALGHCTQLSMLDEAERKALAETVIASKLPIHFVGLPTSDIFMMGRPDSSDSSSHNRPRGTMHVPSMIKQLGLAACLGVNNVGNAFTPFGTGDPLQLASWAVGIYQAGTIEDAELLYDCVSIRARKAIGLEEEDARYGLVHEGRNLRGHLLLRNQQSIAELPGAPGQPRMTVNARQRLSLKDVVWDPPEVDLRSVVS